MGVIAEILKIIEGKKIRPVKQKTFQQVLHEELKKQDDNHFDRRA